MLRLLFSFILIFLNIFKRKSLILIVVLLILFGMFRFQICKLLPEHHIAHFINYLGIEKVQIEGDIVEEPEISSDKVSCLVKLTRLEDVSVQGNILLTIKENTVILFLLYGDHISYRVRYFDHYKIIIPTVSITRNTSIITTFMGFLTFINQIIRSQTGQKIYFTISLLCPETGLEAESTDFIHPNIRVS